MVPGIEPFLREHLLNEWMNVLGLIVINWNKEAEIKRQGKLLEQSSFIISSLFYPQTLGKELS